MTTALPTSVHLGSCNATGDRGGRGGGRGGFGGDRGGRGGGRGGFGGDRGRGGFGGDRGGRGGELLRLAYWYGVQSGGVVHGR